MSPMTIFSLGHGAATRRLASAVAGRGVPGVVGTGVGREGLYRVLPTDPPGPIFSHILSIRPYLRPNEGIIWLNDEVSWDGSR